MTASLFLVAGARGPAPSWETLRADYDYAPGPTHLAEAPGADTADGTVVKVSFQACDGGVARGEFLRPKAAGVYPVVLLLHGLGGSEAEMVAHLAPSFLAKGVAVFALDAPFHGARRTQEGDRQLFSLFMKSQSSAVKGDLVAQVHSKDADGAAAAFTYRIVRNGVIDWRVGLDYLDSRPDVDKTRIGLLGASLGSIMGSILGGVDSRVDCMALCVGGDPILPFASSYPADLPAKAYDISCSLFLGHAAGKPILMLNGSQDAVIPKSATLRLYEAAGQPKSIRWYPAGHGLQAQAFADATDWVVACLKS